MNDFSQKLVPTLTQKLSPQQIQMIKLLELPTVMLMQRVKQEIEENPVLEEEALEDRAPKEEQSDKDVLDSYLDDDTPSYKYYANNYSKDDDRDRQFYISDGRSLSEYLEEQVGYRNLSDRQRLIATYLIGSIDDDGYLRRDMESISDDMAFNIGMEASVDELEGVLNIIHQMEPAGIGARSLQECLLIQLESRPLDTPAKRLAHKVVENYFGEFTKKHYDKLMARLNVTEDQFRDAIEEITSLSPKPGHLFNEDSSEAIPYITPDFILDFHNGEFELSLNSRNIPEVKISRQYVEMIKDAAKANGDSQEKKETLQYIKSKIDSANWFISAIKQRQDTLMRTMKEILDYQQAYFEDGDVSMLRPMILKDIADRTGLDVSTISRVVNSKYVQTHFGIISLKQLFSEAMLTDSGEEVSSHEIKELLKERVESENKRKPYTDEALMDYLNDQGYQIARRTVAKYREMLGIPVARLRKEL